MPHLSSSNASATNLSLSPGASPTTHDVWEVACEGRGVTLTEDAIEVLRRGEEMIDRLIRERRHVYGLTTGFGPLATTLVEPALRATLQEQLTAHLASGVGYTLPPHLGRAILLARAVTLSQGYSCAPRHLVERLTGALNAGCAPGLPAYGSVGASGDLTPLAHACRNLMGEGKMWSAHGELRPAHEVLQESKLTPLSLTDREGLAMVNGTDAMTGIAAINDQLMARLLDHATTIAVGYAEVFEGRLEAWHPRHGLLRGHAGQRRAHALLLEKSAGSARVRASTGAAPLPSSLSSKRAEEVATGQEILQDFYSIRCAPQLFGALCDQLTYHRTTVEQELIAVTDNPIFDPDTGEVHHGGNFYGQHVSFASDALRTGVLKLMAWFERVADRLCDEKKNRGRLPPFLVWERDRVGLHSGFMGAQVSASALLALGRTRASTQASAQSISTNADNQDIVSMGTIAAISTFELFEHAASLCAITSMMLARAMELISPTLEGFAPSSQELFARVRSHSPRLERDRPLADEIAALARALPYELPREGDTLTR